MKTLGLLGGMSWESTVPYYQLINQGINRRLGGLHSAKMLLYSVDFYEIGQLQQAGQWDEMAEILSAVAQRLEAGGAEGIVLCTNTMHRVAPQIEARIAIPLLHIADATAEHIKRQGYRRVGLLGTKFTMEQDFYSGRLREKHGIETLTPEPADRQIIHDVIYRELCAGHIVEPSRQEFLRIIASLHDRGVEAVVLGCTEIPLLVQQSHTTVPLLDTLRIHAEQAVTWALDT